MNTSSPTSSLSRRDALKLLGTTGLLAGLGLMGGSRLSATDSSTPAHPPQPFQLPRLAYAYDALEPHIDARTMEIHHTKHHQAYVTQLNKALADHPDLMALGGEALLAKLGDIPEPLRTTLRNNLGGHLNHAFFWQLLSPTGGGRPQGELAKAIDVSFQSFDAFKTQFADAAMKRFGSGWAWLLVENGKLSIRSTANQDSPLMEGAIPVIGIDVWEHAYYLKYQNRRADYVAAFWNVVDWNAASHHYATA
jgi:Fe-Mn family superoxide dismutase